MFKTIAISPEFASQYLGENIQSICDITTKPYPIMIYIDNNIDKDLEYEIQCISQQEIENIIGENNGKRK